jgi:diketogulonate reductase-like aldo/keto reductase
MSSPMPRLGMGTWHMGESAAQRSAEVAALREGIDLGMRLVDTAEMYADGRAEEVVGEAIKGRREDVFLVTKFYPHHASRKTLVTACERSLERLGVDGIDLYLLHWRGRVPLEETVEGLERLVETGKVERWGVSNLDVADMEELTAIAGGANVFANQVLYNPRRRGIEYDLLPWCEKHGVAVMAYSPLDEGALAADRRLATIAARLGVSASQLALAWVLRRKGVCAIPKAGRIEHVRANAKARELAIDDDTLREIDRIFPPPSRKQRLEIV